MNLEGISLSDCRIRAIEKNDKNITIELEEAYNIISGKFIKDCKVIIRNWEGFTIKQFISLQPFSKATEKVLSENNFEPFEIIQELELLNNKLLLKGFSKKSGHWMEWEFVNSVHELQVNAP